MNPFITCTGIDERTDLHAVADLAIPGIEFGILLSANPEGRNRYPGIPWLLQAVNALRRRSAIHVCGAEARRRLMAGEYDDFLRDVGRIQVNGVVEWDDVVVLLRRLVRQRIVTQFTLANSSHAAPWTWYGAGRHDLLVDGSGGRGIRPDEWSSPATDKRVGFAGGLGPDNLATEIRRIQPVMRQGWWVDMESGLRTNDWFDIAKARRCIEIATAFAEGR